MVGFSLVSSVRQFGQSDESDGQDLPNLGDMLPEPRFDALLEGNRRCGTALAGPSEAQQQRPVLVVEVHDFDVAFVRSDVGAESVQGGLDPVENLQSIHTTQR